jgi:hypothetical protein
MNNKKEIAVFNGRKRIGRVHLSLDGESWWGSVEGGIACGPYVDQRAAINGVNFWHRRKRAEGVT